MKLNQKQRQRINRYLRDVLQLLEDIPEAKRREMHAQLRARLERELMQFGDGPLSDETIERVLQTCGTPAAQAASLKGEAAPAPVQEAMAGSRVWLGLCGALADRLGVDPYVIRTMMVLLGLLPPLLPLLLIGYVGIYLVLYYTSEATNLPPIHLLPLAKQVATVVAIAVALFFGFEFALELTRRLVWRFLEINVVPGREWGWLPLHSATLFLWSAAVSAPLATMSCLPVSKGWDGTLKKISQAVVALYALVLCFGFASYLVGIVLLIAENVSGIPAIQTLL